MKLLGQTVELALRLLQESVQGYLKITSGQDLGFTSHLNSIIKLGH